MGTLEIILAACSAAAVWVALQLGGAWMRAEVIACYDPLIRWLILRGVARFPESERLSAQAELLENNAKIKSPSWRLFDAASFYLKSGCASRAFAKQDSEHATRAPSMGLWRRASEDILIGVTASLPVSVIGYFFLNKNNNRFEFYFALMMAIAAFTLWVFLPMVDAVKNTRKRRHGQSD